MEDPDQKQSHVKDVATIAILVIGVSLIVAFLLAKLGLEAAKMLLSK